MEIIDLTQTIFEGMPVHHTQSSPKISAKGFHNVSQGSENVRYPSSNWLEMSEHTGTHVDALSHMSAGQVGQTIETMPLTSFIGPGVCLDVSHRSINELITVKDLTEACAKKKIQVNEGDIVLLYTDHFRKHFHTLAWSDGPGLSEDACRWLGEQGVIAFGVETMAPGVKGKSNRLVHQICGEMEFTHYENLVNLHLLASKVGFQFIGLPLKINEGTGSPVRAVAIID